MGSSDPIVTVRGLASRDRLDTRADISLEQALERSRRLERVAGALAEALTPQQVLDAVLAEGVPAADARAGLIALVSEDGEFLEVVAESGYRSDQIEGFKRFPLSDEYPLGRVVRSGEPIFLRSRKERDEAFPLFRTSAEPSHALVLLPLVVSGRAIGGLTFSFDRDQEFDAGRRALKVALAQQTALAIERARLYDNEQKLRVAEETARKRVSFLAEASVLLSSSLNYEQTLKRLAELAVPGLADWCSIDMVDDQGGIERLAVVHSDPQLVAYAEALQHHYPIDPDAPTGVPYVLRTREPELYPDISDELLIQVTEGDDELLRILRGLGLSSSICVPLVARGQILGALTLVAAESGRRYSKADLELALELASRAAIAADNARLYREMERRSDAARALAYVDDGVILVDRLGLVRHWNRAAERLTGVREDAARGAKFMSVLPGWEALAGHVDADSPGRGRHNRAVTLPLPVDGEERWLSVSAVSFDGGTVYALRDVTAEHELEQTRSDFVATASHELRTPLAAVYGAVRTLLRDDIELEPETLKQLLLIIESESERLNGIVAQILFAGQLDAGTLRVQSEILDPTRIAASVFDSARLRAPDTVKLSLLDPGERPKVVGDESKLRQVLVNLVDNAIKYSPDGGEVTVAVSAAGEHVRVSISDQGLGIPATEQSRIFEKFYRLDPVLSRGIGGSGLGLYISRELVQRMDGHLTVSSNRGEGSTFVVELPRASEAVGSSH